LIDQHNLCVSSQLANRVYSVFILGNQSNQQADDIYELLGRSINQLVKYFDEPEKKVKEKSFLFFDKCKFCVERIDNTDSLWWRWFSQCIRENIIIWIEESIGYGCVFWWRTKTICLGFSK